MEGMNCCDLEIDVNGEETFIVDKKIISLWSGRLRKLFKSTSKSRSCKVIFNDFPGGPESFEFVSRFCYNNGNIDINPSKVAVLNCAAEFMEMNDSVAGSNNLVERTGKLLEEICYWTWSDVLATLKQCQELRSSMISPGIVEKCVDSLVGWMALSSESSPCPSTSSPDSCGLRCSFDTRSMESFKLNLSRAAWWFEDLLVLNTNLLEIAVKSMVWQKFDHGIISKFLFYYQKSKALSCTSDEKRRIVESVSDMLHILDWNSVSCKSLFAILRVALSLNVGKRSISKLESMVGSQLDQTTLDNLLIPSPCGSSYLYDVNLVLRLVKACIRGGAYLSSPAKMRKVSSLIDMYISEVAPDPCLKPSKFLALATALPDSARESFDEIYHAVDTYMEVHSELTDAEKAKICSVLNYEKLSEEVCIHLSQNRRFPPKIVGHAILLKQLRLKDLLNRSTNSPSNRKGSEAEGNERVALYAAEYNTELSTESEKLKAHIRGMQLRVMELEKVCKKMQTQISEINKSKVATPGRGRSLPKLCS